VRLAPPRGVQPLPGRCRLVAAGARHSHALARLAVLEARGSFGTAHAAIADRCGPVIGKRQVEQSVVNAAAGIAAFYAARVPVPCTASTLLVISADSKGVVMRPGALRPATARAAARQGKMRTRLAAGEKPNRKRMAALACACDADPARRRPHDVIAPPGGRHGCRALRPRPKAKAKWLAGSVEHNPAEVIAAAFGQAEARDPARRRTWVVLVLRDAEDADEGGVHDADGNPGESGGVVGEVSATSARCRNDGVGGRMQPGWTVDGGRDARQRACGGRERRGRVSRPGTGPAAGLGSAP
jgi:hypothetical protein